MGGWDSWPSPAGPLPKPLPHAAARAQAAKNASRQRVQGPGVTDHSAPRILYERALFQSLDRPPRARDSAEFSSQEQSLSYSECKFYVPVHHFCGTWAKAIIGIFAGFFTHFLL